MYKYILKRLVLLIPVIIGVSLLVFSIMDIAEGDPVYQIVSETASEEVIEATREAYGLNDPFLVRYARYMINLCKGSMGTSYITKQDVFKTYMELLPNTVKLSLLAVVIAIIVSIPLGINAAIHQNTWADTGSMFTSLLFVSMPQFWLGLLLMLAFCVHIKVFPVISSAGDLRSIFLPALTLALAMSSKYTRQVRTAVLEEMNQDYVVGARERGVRESVILWRNVFPNALLPLITMFGLSVGSLLGGTSVVEVIFSYPGLGNLAVSAITSSDYNLIQGYVLWLALIYMVINLLVDASYGAVDPRMRAKEQIR